MSSSLSRAGRTPGWPGTRGAAVIASDGWRRTWRGSRWACARWLHTVCTEAEAADTDAARLAAYDQLRQMISWLHHPLQHPEVYDL